MRISPILVMVVFFVAAFVNAQSDNDDGDDSNSSSLTPCRALYKKQTALKRMGAFIPKCDEQGNFHPVQRRGSTIYCSSKLGKDLAYVSHVSESRRKNCKCVVDQHESDLGSLGKKLICDKLGNYDKVQCSGSACHCSDPHGVKINSTETAIDNFYSMNCECATAAHEYRKSGLIGLKFTCDAIGNYDEIQCRGSVCYCVDAMGYEVNGTERSIAEYEFINCPVRAPTPEFQPCKAAILKQLERPNVPGAIHFACDDEGYFNLVQQRSNMLLCVSPDGKYLGYPTRVGDPDASKKNCQCAADIFESNPKSYVSGSSKCDKLGNYKPRQCNGFECYCVDSEGKRQEDTNC